MKEIHNLKVYSSSQTRTSSHHLQYIEVPMIRLQGNYLSDAGFHPANNIKVTISDNQIIIKKDT